MMIKCSVAWDGLPNGMEGELGVLGFVCVYIHIYSYVCVYMSIVDIEQLIYM